MNNASAKLAHRRRGVAVALLAAMAALLAAARAGNAASPEPDRWVVDCRHLPSAQVARASADELKYWHVSSDESRASRWQATDVGNFAASAAVEVVTIYVHGNQVSSSGAFREANTVARILGFGTTNVGGRLITFSWPSTRIEGKPIRDVRVKACRSDRYAPALAHFIAAQPDGATINLIGHSYGARMIALALDQLADEGTRRSGPIHAVLLGGALNNNWLLPGHRCGKAMSEVDSMIVTTNPCDPVLRWYPLLWGLRHRGPDALGDTGLACRSLLGDELAKYRQINVSCAIGKSHDWQDYLSAARVRDEVRALMASPSSADEPVNREDSVASTLPSAVAP